MHLVSSIAYFFYMLSELEYFLTVDLKFSFDQLNASPAEPRYTLPLQTV